MRRTAALAISGGLALGLFAFGLNPVDAASSYKFSSPKGVHAIGANKTAIALDWGTIAGAPKYRIQVARNAEMADSTTTTSAAGQSKTTLSGLRPNTNYFVRASATSADGKKLLSAPSQPVLVRTATAYTAPAVRVATFNVCAKSCSYSKLTPWDKGRAEMVARTIIGSGTDVIGIQEAGFRNRELARLTKALAPTYVLAADYQQASGESVSLYYKTSTLLKDGPAAGFNLQARSGKSWKRSGAYATFRQKATGKTVSIVNVHTTPYEGSRQDKDRLAEVKIANTNMTAAYAKWTKPVQVKKHRTVTKRVKVKGKWVNKKVDEKYYVTENRQQATPPRVWIGDFNSFSIKTQSNRSNIYNYLRSVGHADAASSTTNLTNWQMNSLNSFNSQDRSHRSAKHMDHVYVPKAMKVLRWEQERSPFHNARKAFESDHNMLWADLGL